MAKNRTHHYDLNILPKLLIHTRFPKFPQQNSFRSPKNPPQRNHYIHHCPIWRWPRDLIVSQPPTQFLESSSSGQFLSSCRPCCSTELTLCYNQIFIYKCIFKKNVYRLVRLQINFKSKSLLACTTSLNFINQHRLNVFYKFKII